MLKDCIEIFEKELKVKGDKMITDDYLPADGTYIIVSVNDDNFKVKDVIDIKYDKKTGEIQGRDSIYFNDICNYDYNSVLIDMNKPVDSKKIIHSNNYLSFFVKKESLISKNENEKPKLNLEIIDNYYKVLSNPYEKYSKGKDKEIYNTIEKTLEEIDQELLEGIKEWIKKNVFNLSEFGVEIKGKNYLKIFFDVSIEKYKIEGSRYLLPKIYNSNDYNQMIENVIYGLPNNNMNLNSKKPYLENKSRKIKLPTLLNEKEVLLQKKFFEYLMNLASKGKVNVYINDGGIKAYKNGEMPEVDFKGNYMRIRKGKEVEIHSYDTVTSYKYLLNKPFKFQNILGISDKFLKEQKYDIYNDRKNMQKIFNDILFSKYLINNYYTEPEDIAIKDNSIKKNLLISRQPIFDYIYKGNENGIYGILNKVSLDLVKNSIKNGYIPKASHQYNLKCSLENYFKGGKNMGDIIYELKNNLREKINSDETQSFKNDEEYFFAVGQFVSYLLSKNKGKNKPHSLANPFINAKNDIVIKEKLRNIFKRYNYDIDMNGRRVKNIYAMIVAYEPQGKVNQDLIIGGYLHSNLIYESKKGE